MPADVAWVSGAACLVARRAFDAVGGFDPGFFLYKEEEDLFLRIRRGGGRVRYLPSVRVRHDAAATGVARGPPARLGGAVPGQARPLALAAARDASRAPRRGGLGRAARPPERAALLILLLHNRYRTPGGEERAVEDLAWLIRGELGEPAAVLERDSEALGPARAAAGLLGGGLRPAAVGDAVRRSGARVLHAHNVHPAFGWRALAAAREAGARVVLHLHNYRLVCAIGTCFTRGEDCTRCHGRNTLPGVRLNCRGSRAESLVYGASLALWQRRLAEAVDAFAVPSEFALGRLEELGAPLGGRARVVPSVQRSIAAASTAASGRFALAAGRLTPEKGFEDAIRALRGGRRAARGRRRRAAARASCGRWAATCGSSGR